MKHFGNFSWAICVLFLVIACGLAFRFYNVFEFNPMQMLSSDPGRHWHHAVHPLDGQPTAFIDAIFYQVWLGTWSKLTLGVPIMVALYAGLISVVTPWLWYRFFSRAGGGEAFGPNWFRGCCVAAFLDWDI